MSVTAPCEPMLIDTTDGGVAARGNLLGDVEPFTLPPSTMVIFGITGDLSRRKLLPAIYDLTARGLLPSTFSLLGFGRRHPSQVLAMIREAMVAGARTPFQESVWELIAHRFRYVCGAFDDRAAFEALRDELLQTDDSLQGSHNYAFYMSVSPDYFTQVCAQLKAVGLHSSRDGWRRVVVEKPFGNDLLTSRTIGAAVSSVFGDSSVYRVDHYLGKETVQNILAMRFVNGLFEPLWNHRYIDHVQITMAEDIGVTGRAGYYDGVGAARDVIQNHLLQLLALIAMEEPITLSADDLAAEKVKVLSATSPVEPLQETTARGQYAAAVRNGNYFPGLLDEDGFDTASTTETYAAMAVQISNRRWAGVPFYLRTGKRLTRRTTGITVVFRPAPHLHSRAEVEQPPHNTLVIRVQPDDGILLRIGAKVPGDGMRIQDVDLAMSYEASFRQPSPEAYERLILDVLRGDASLFPTQAEVEASWAIVDPVIEYWTSTGRPDVYASGSAGPASADAVLTRSGRAWRQL
nr:glucose-6-phosphate dehydrogenase [Antrihabitans sp. YC2-6]